MPEAPASAPKHSFSLQELLDMDFPELVWWVDRIITSGVTLLWGSSKAGKSLLALHLLLAIVTPGYALGHLSCRYAQVLFISLEDGARRLQTRVRAAGALPTHDFHIFTEWPRGILGIEKLSEYLTEADGVKVVCIDTLALFTSLPDMNDYAATVAMMARLKDVADRHDVAIIAIHHSKKPAKDSAGDMIHTALGSTGLVAGADHLLFLKRTPTGPAEAVLHFRSKDAPEAELALRFNHDIQGWEYVGDAAEMAETDERQEVLDLLRDNGEAMTTRDVAKALKKSDSAASKLLKKLADTSKVRKLSYGLWTIETPVETGKTGTTGKTSGEETDKNAGSLPTLPGFPGSDGPETASRSSVHPVHDDTVPDPLEAETGLGLF